MPEDLLNCDKFMTISFKYFASAMRLFQDEVWLDTYHHYALRLKNNGLTFSGMSPDNLLPEILEISSHPWFIGVQFHPELKSKPFNPHPLFSSFINASLKQSRLL